MPIPKPRDNGESQTEFMQRCMSDDIMQEYEREQRYAICMTQWQNRNKSEANMDIQRKSFSGIQLKAGKEGTFEAVIATLNVVDNDGDVTLPGAFPEGKTILLSAYQHGSWNGGLPVGKAVIHEAGDRVIIKGEFNLNTTTGRDHYETAKFAPELQEWSYGFIPLEAPEGEWEGQKVRLLKKLDVFEASQVLRGAGVDTGILAIKSLNLKGAISYNQAHSNGTPKAPESAEWDGAKEVAAASVDDLAVMCAWVDSENRDLKTAYKLPHHRASGEHPVVWRAVAAAMVALMGGRGGVDIPAADKKGVYNHLAKHYAEFDKEPPEFRSSMDDEYEMALAAINDINLRFQSLADLRRKEGRVLSSANRERINNLLNALSAVAEDLKGLLADTDVSKEKAQRALLEFLKIENQLLEVN